MTAAQKIAKEKFKKAIAYRQKTGVSLKEAFAHVYGKKTVKKKAAKKVVPKKAAKKVVPKKAAKKVGVIKRKVVRKKSAKRKPTEKAVLKSIKHAVSVQKSHMGSLHKADHTIITKYKNNIEEIAKQNQYLLQWQYALKQQNTKANKIICRNRINEIKKYISELKNHARELKKLLK
jgi:hypothetical protein